MIIESLRLLNFRNYSDLKVEFNPKVNILVGANGQGKTNLLEAVQLMCTGESFRPSTNTDYISTQLSKGEHSLINSKLIHKNISKTIEQRHYADKKESFLNNKKVSSEQLKKLFNTVVFTPDSLNVVKMGPGERRQMLDAFLASMEPTIISLIMDFQKCLKTRNRLLKNYTEGITSLSETTELLDSLNPIYMPQAALLSYQRILGARALIQNAKTLFQDIIGDQNVDITVDYVVSGQSAIDWSENQVYDALNLRLRELQGAELSAGQSLVGPHKHDVRFMFNGQDARFYCSQGQQRAIILAFKIAQIFVHYEKQGEFPVLILDDVFSELDAQKRQSLLKILSQIQAQIFITTTELEMQNSFTQKEQTTFYVDKGNLKTSGWN